MRIRAHRSGENNRASAGVKGGLAWLAKKRVFHWLAFLLCIIVSGYLLWDLAPAAITYDDTLSYWAAGRLFASAQNPYAPELLLALRSQAGELIKPFPPDAIAMILYPPWTLPFIAPLGIVSYSMGRLVWFVFHLAVVFFCARWIWLLYRGPRELHWMAYVVAFTFIPTLFVLLMGHFTTLHLLGLVGFLYFISRPGPRTRSDLAAGACAALVTFKPQLLFIFMLALLLWTVEQRRWMVLAGGAAFLLVASALAILVNPVVFAQFWQALGAYAVGTWASPTLGMVLRRAFGHEREWLQLLPLLLGLVWLIFYWAKHRRHWDWLERMPMLVLACFLTSAYMWSYDMVILLLPVLQVTILLLNYRARWAMALMVAVYLSINALMIYQFITIHDDYYSFWLPAALLAWWLLGNHLARPGLARAPASDPVWTKEYEDQGSQIWKRQ